MNSRSSCLSLQSVSAPLTPASHRLSGTLFTNDLLNFPHLMLSQYLEEPHADYSYSIYPDNRLLPTWDHFYHHFLEFLFHIADASIQASGVLGMISSI